jgi:CheY-like chemotaxis protein
MSNIRGISKELPTVLLVEEDEVLREDAASELRAAGLQVVAAMNGDIAMVMLESGLPADLLLTGIAMPGELDGPALSRRARGLRPELKVLYVGAAAAARRHGGATPVPVSSVLPKSYRPGQLVAAVTRTLGLCPVTSA